MIEKTYRFIQNGNVNDVYTLTNTNGMQVDILTYGARILRISVPDRNGNFSDVVVGFDSPESYYGKNPYFGATVGRYANRIGNAQFTLDGTTYFLQANKKAHLIHGGTDGDFSRKIWRAEIENDTLVLSHVALDGESGFPGNLQVKTYFSLTQENALIIRYEAVSDRDTVCNLTNHTYFNLSGEDTVLDHEVWIDAKQITACDEELIPDGTLLDIDGTAYSFASPKPIGRDIFANERMLQLCGGYDFNYVLSKRPNELALCAYVYDPKTGRKMECLTTQPGMQLYTGNTTGGYVGKKAYVKHCAVCLETQAFPNSPNCPDFPSTVLRKGETYNHTTIYRFSVIK